MADFREIQANWMGGNTDSYTNRGKIWNQAKRFNQQSIDTNGSVTCVRRRKVDESKYEPVGLL